FAYNTSDGSLRHLIDSLARRLDIYAVVLFILIVAWLAARRFGITAYTREAWAVVALAALAVPLLSKTTWPYYYLEPFIFLLIWEFASMHDRRAGLWRWPVLSLSFLAVTGTLSQFTGLRSVGAGDRIAVGLLEFGAMLAFVLATWTRLRAAKPEVTSAGAWPGQPWFRRSAAPVPSPAIPAGSMNPMNPMNPMGPMPPGMPVPMPSPAQYMPPPSAPSGRSPLWPGNQTTSPPQPQLGPGPFPNGPPGAPGPEDGSRGPWGTR
ncbi:MAG TPA: hypothetical protein VF916_04155, partial [Ktedonobacterales bacterium]